MKLIRVHTLKNDLSKHLDGAAIDEAASQRNPNRRSPGSNLGRRRVDFTASVDADVDVDQVVVDAGRHQDDQLLDRCHHEQRSTEQRSFEADSNLRYLIFFNFTIF